MNWSVTYRAKDGKQTVGVFEAESREALFKALASKGIAAIRIEQGTGKKPQSKTRQSTLNVARGIAAGAIVIALAAGSWYLLKQSHIEPAHNAKEKRPSRIVEATPEISARAVEPTPEPPVPKEVPYWERESPEGLTFRQKMKWNIHHRPPAAYTNNTSQTEPRPAYAIFDTRSDNSIAALLTVPPGTAAVGDPEYELWFTRDFLKSLETPIIVTKDDTPEEAQLKRDMIATKIDLKARYDAGEDIALIMKESREELQRLSVYRTEIESAFREMTSKPGITEQDVDDFVESANIMLEAKGIAPMTLGPIAKRRLLRKANGY